MSALGVDVVGAKPTKHADVVLGEDWIGPDAAAESEARRKRDRRGVIAMNRSPLARKIITFNLLAILVLVAGVLFLNPFRDSLVVQRERSLVIEAELLSSFFEAGLQDSEAAGLGADGSPDPAAILASIDIPNAVEIFVFDASGGLVATTMGRNRTSQAVETLDNSERSTVISDLLHGIWEGISSVSGKDLAEAPEDPGNTDRARSIALEALSEDTLVRSTTDLYGNTIFTVGTPIERNGVAIGAVAIASAAGEIDQLVRSEREQVLQMFVIAILVSIGLSLVLASTIANPLSDLAAAAEIGREKNSRRISPSRVRIPDLTARPDEIGRLSGALRGMVAALYDRIDANEQFAADVAHEIKNPLASLRSAVASLRDVERPDHREKLLDVIEHDTRRLDRLVSDISNASRLDSELVKEDEEPFDLLKMIGNLGDYLGEQARDKGVEFITDMPSDPIVIEGLESRLAQVFVNLISNAISFCEDGDAIRVWVRKRENRVLVVVEDTGPGIPEQALTKIFNRFYTERPVGHFGNNSGLGLSISKQIVEAHGGVIWAENIRPTDADITSEPLGARFVVGLPV
ncbi:histidine kinase [Alphaproteobacteria bacterium GH1-50]|uniref:histidine kinase n=1 Tax=Kangsaoukella pontilimi TaxID=2691042 RepID=A0A7C9IG52_9RHOB|nr:sensor histidine kinase [Kangsaoukella pontilimi]MXQ08068.1 histidine kinase [Kangsaoukella pontilimi]